MTPLETVDALVAIAGGDDGLDADMRADVAFLRERVRDYHGDTLRRVLGIVAPYHGRLPGHVVAELRETREHLYRRDQ